jgi:hypothetical protein
MLYAGPTAEQTAEAVVNDEAHAFVLPELATVEALNAMPMDELKQAATAMKKVLILHRLQMIADDYTITRGNYMASALLAARLKAPQAYAEIFAVRAHEHVSNEQYSQLATAEEMLYSLYGVDSVAVKFFTDAAVATPDELADELAVLPLECMFNTPTNMPLTDQQVESAAKILCSAYTMAQQLYAGVTDASSAQLACVQLRPLLPAVVESLFTVQQADSLQKQRLNELISTQLMPAYEAFSAEEKRLKDVGFYGVARLKLINYCFSM